MKRHKALIDSSESEDDDKEMQKRHCSKMKRNPSPLVEKSENDAQGQAQLSESDSELAPQFVKETARRGSARLQEKANKVFEMPSRESVLGKIASVSTTRTNFSELRSRKHINDLLKVTNRYNFDPDYTSDSSLASFIENEEEQPSSESDNSTSENVEENESPTADNRKVISSDSESDEHASNCRPLVSDSDDEVTDEKRDSVPQRKVKAKRKISIVDSESEEEVCNIDEDKKTAISDTGDGDDDNVAFGYKRRSRQVLEDDDDDSNVGNHSKCHEIGSENESTLISDNSDISHNNGETPSKSNSFQDVQTSLTRRQLQMPCPEIDKRLSDDSDTNESDTTEDDSDETDTTEDDSEYSNVQSLSHRNKIMARKKKKMRKKFSKLMEARRAKRHTKSESKVM